MTLEEMTSRIDTAEGWSDIFLKITSERKTDSAHIYTAEGLFNGKTVGLEIEIISQIDAGIVDGKPDGQKGFIIDAVKIRSLGNKSDDFVKSLALLYHVPTDKGFSKQDITATAFSLNEQRTNLDKPGYYKLKVFLEENDENLYSEFFLNINTDKREIEIHEKDEDYRKPIIEVFTR